MSVIVDATLTPLTVAVFAENPVASAVTKIVIASPTFRAPDVGLNDNPLIIGESASTPGETPAPGEDV